MEKAARKETERQYLGASGVTTSTDKKESFKDKHKKMMEQYNGSDDEAEDRVGNSESNEELDNEAQEMDVKARKELNRMFGKFHSDEYRKRDNEKIVESRPDEIEREEKFSKLIAEKEDQEEEEKERLRRLMKKKKKLKRVDESDEEDYADREDRDRDDEDRD